MENKKLFVIARAVAYYFDVDEPDINADTHELAMFIKNALNGKLPDSKHCPNCAGILVLRITGGVERYHCKQCFSIFDIKKISEKGESACLNN
ncbi:MAG: hypothetical protein N2Z73_01160 [Endomicrobia bacterium]|nr:hypothetical protein [Endomicrobiia bacterium]